MLVAHGHANGADGSERLLIDSLPADDAGATALKGFILILWAARREKADRLAALKRDRASERAATLPK